VFGLAAEQGMKVMLDGQGADEILGGYDGYFVPRWMEDLLKGRLGSLESEIRAHRALRGRGVMSSHLLLGRWLLRWAAPGLMHWADGKWGLSAEVSQVIALKRQYSESPDRPAKALRSQLGPLAGYAMSKTLDQSLVELLRYEDRNSMAFGVEA